MERSVKIPLWHNQSPNSHRFPLPEKIMTIYSPHNSYICTVYLHESSLHLLSVVCQHQHVSLPLSPCFQFHLCSVLQMTGWQLQTGSLFISTRGRGTTFLHHHTTLTKTKCILHVTVNSKLDKAVTYFVVLCLFLCLWQIHSQYHWHQCQKSLPPVVHHEGQEEFQPIFHGKNYNRSYGCNCPNYKYNKRQRYLKEACHGSCHLKTFSIYGCFTFLSLILRDSSCFEILCGKSACRGPELIYLCIT